MAEKKKEEFKENNSCVPSRTNILRYRPKKYDTRNKEDDGKRKHPPKTL